MKFGPPNSGSYAEGFQVKKKSAHHVNVDT